MTDPTKPEADKQKFAPQHVADANNKTQQGRKQERADVARGSEPATRSAGSGRG